MLRLGKVQAYLAKREKELKKQLRLSTEHTRRITEAGETSQSRSTSWMHGCVLPCRRAGDGISPRRRSTHYNLGSRINTGNTMIEKIISGGQTGVDRAALEVAVEMGIACGGWCPAGRKAEDGEIPARYPMQELPSRGYRPRTKRNVRESDGTLILFREKLAGGSAFTAEVAQKDAKPCYKVDLAAHANPGEAMAWIEQNRIKVLNIAGPRESHAPGIYSAAITYLRELFRIAHQGRY